MKTLVVASLHLALGCIALFGQDLAPVTPGGTPAVDSGAYAVVQRSANSRTWERTEYERAPDGQAVPRVHRVIELGSGICWQLPTGEWTDSGQAFELTPEGYAVASHSSTQLRIAPNLNTQDGVLYVQGADGRIFRSVPIGLNLYSPLTGQSVQVDSVKDCEGYQTADNEITFLDAFQGLKANVRFRNELGQYHQEILLTEKLTPRQLLRLGFPVAALDSLRLEIWTEFLQAPDPSVQVTVLKSQSDPVLRAAMVDPDTTDASIDFGAAKLGRGIAFAEGQPAQAVTVFKQWLVEPETGRRFLVEASEYQALLPLLAALPESTIADAAKPSSEKLLASVAALPSLNGYQPPVLERRPSSLSRRGKAGLRGSTAPELANGSYLEPAPSISPAAIPRRSPAASHRPFLIAKLDPSRRTGGPQLTMDYVSLGSFVTNYVFQGDCTYAISSTVNMYGSNVCEGGAILKFYSNACLNVASGSFNLRAAASQPVYFTSKDDHSSGENFGTGTPVGYYANPVLNLPSLGSLSLTNVRFAYARQALTLSSTTLSLYHAQFINCQAGVSLTGGGLKLRNALFANTLTNFNIQSATSIDAQNVTFGNSAYLATASGAGSTVALTNCILANVTNLNSGYPALSGDCNGFYSAPTFGTTIYSSTSYPFQIVGGGGYYLAEGCVFRSGAATNLDPALLLDLRKRTTAPPLVYSNATLSADTILSPQAPRDATTQGLGFHYFPLDYAFGGTTANGNLTFTPGTAVGWFRTSSGWNHAGHGIHAGDGKTVAFNGTVEAPCYWVRCNTVQEGCNGLWQGGYGPAGLTGWAASTATAPTIQARFLRASQLANDALHFRDDNGWLIVRAAHSEFYAGGLGGYASSEYVTNCMFLRNSLWLAAGQLDIAWDLRNCTFLGGSFNISRSANPCLVSVRDTAFDTTLVSTADQYASNATYTYYNFNASNSTTNRTTPPGANDLVVTNFNWQSSWLGNYYVPTNSPLVNTGSVTADLVGLYHFTSQTNQQKELSSQVDRGYHYVAVNPATGVAYDQDGDGIPDYLEDVNGNGIATDDPTSWTNYNSGNGLTLSTGLQVFTPLK